MTSTDLFDPLPLILTTIVDVVVLLYLILEDENSNTSTNEVEEQSNLAQQFTAMMIVTTSQKRNNDACELDDGNPNRRKKQQYVEYDHLRTKNAIYQDYLGPSPIFNNTSFQWIFRILQNAYYLLKTSLLEHLFFNVEEYNICG